MQRMKRCQSAVEIARELFTTLCLMYEDSGEITIFLCGGGDPEDIKLRRRISRALSDKFSKYRYVVYLAEDMFMDLLYGQPRVDLLTLEDQLAKGVTCVTILLQSAGTFTELGAFANSELLRSKLVVIVEPKHRRDKSFINRGPIQLLKEQKPSKVRWETMALSNTRKLAQVIGETALLISKQSSQQMDLANPISSYRFYWALAYVFDPIPRKAVIGLSRKIAGEDWSSTTKAAMEAAISFLVRNRLLSGTEELSVTETGIQKLIHNSYTKKNALKLINQLSEYRTQALNLTLRKKPKKSWGVVVRP